MGFGKDGVEGAEPRLCPPGQTAQRRLPRGERQSRETHAAGMTIEEVKKTVQLLKRLNESATVIVVEHDMNFIRMIARRVTVMHQGEAFAEGSMEEIEGNEGVRDIYLGKGEHYAYRH